MDTKVKIKEVFEAKLYENNGNWYVWHNGLTSPALPTRERAAEWLQMHYDQAVEQYGDKYEVELKLID